MVLLVGLGIWGWAVRDPAKAALERDELRRQRNQTELVPNTYGFDTAFCNILTNALPYADPEQPPTVQEQVPQVESLQFLFDQLVTEAPPNLAPSAQELANSWRFAVSSGNEQALAQPRVEAARQALRRYEVEFCR
jgi:hypothetical protein